MFLSGLSKSWVDREGQQHAQGAFLILMSSSEDAKSRVYRGLVRRVRLHQSGHFMVGSVSIGVERKWYRVHLSGAYGADGLIRDVPPEVYAVGVDLPAELHEKWSKGGGHNSAGAEAPDMDAWAKTLPFPASTYFGKVAK